MKSSFKFSFSSNCWFSTHAQWTQANSELWKKSSSIGTHRFSTAVFFIPLCKTKVTVFVRWWFPPGVGEFFHFTWGLERKQGPCIWGIITFFSTLRLMPHTSPGWGGGGWGFQLTGALQITSTVPASHKQSFGRLNTQDCQVISKTYTK